MANMPKKSEKAQIIARGVVRSKNGKKAMAEFYYAGGSRFGLIWSSGERGVISKTALENLISAKQVRVVDEKQWRNILAQIRPDGSTETHNADGTRKTHIETVKDMLISDGELEKHNDGTVRLAKDPTKAKDVKAPSSMGKKMASMDALNSPLPVEEGMITQEKWETKAAEGGVGAQAAKRAAAAASGASAASSAPAGDDSGESAPARGLSAVGGDGGADGQDQAEAFDDEGSGFDDGEDEPMPEIRQAPPASDVRERRARLANDLNGDGVVDEFDDLVAEEQKKNGLVMVVFIGGILLSIALFVVVYTFVGGLVHGGPTNPLEAVGIVAPEESAPVTQQEGGGTTAGDEGEGEGEDVPQSTLETVERTDFDPETAVIAYPMADSDGEAKATTLIKMIKEAINNANIDGFNEAVDIERIAGLIAPEYAWRAAEIQNMTELQRQQMMEYYHQTFRDNERQHVVNKDPYASIFGGRIREVRRDPHDVNKLYIVMEAISGDHQRICFIMEGDGAGQWTITGITDPKGYVKMIQQGVVEDQAQSKSKK